MPSNKSVKTKNTKTPQTKSTSNKPVKKPTSAKPSKPATKKTVTKTLAKTASSKSTIKKNTVKSTTKAPTKPSKKPTAKTSPAKPSSAKRTIKSAAKKPTAKTSPAKPSSATIAKKANSNKAQSTGKDAKKSPSTNIQSASRTNAIQRAAEGIKKTIANISHTNPSAAPAVDARDSAQTPSDPNKDSGDTAPHKTENKIVDIIGKLTKIYKEDGLVTFDEINDLLPEESGESYSDIISFLQDARVKIGKVKKSKKNTSRAEDGSEEYNEVIKNSTKMYVSKITDIPLLTKQNEVEIAKRIEGGRNSLLEALSKIPEVHQYIMKIYDQIVSDSILIREVVEIDSLYYSKFGNNYSDGQQGNSEEGGGSNFDSYSEESEESEENYDDENYTDENFDSKNEEPDSDIEYVKEGTISFTTMEKTLNSYVIKAFAKMCEISKQMIKLLESNKKIDIFKNDRYKELSSALFELMQDSKIHQSVTNSLMDGVNAIHQEIINYEYQIINLLSSPGIESSEIVRDFIQKYDMDDVKILDKKLNIENPKLLQNIKSHHSELASIIKKFNILQTRKMLVSSSTFKKLVVQMQKSNRDTVRAKQTMIQSNLKLVLAIAKRYSNKSVPLLDLIQEGNIGLIKAVDKFEYRRECKFATYATWWIKQRVSKGINDQGKGVRIPVHMIENCSKMNKIKRDLLKKLGREPTPDEIAKKMGMTVEKVLKIMRIVRDTMSLEIPVGDEDGASIGSFIEDVNIKNPFGTVAEHNLKEITSKQLATLTPREERVLRMRFGIGLPSDHTLEEVGITFGVTRERVRQIEAKALRKLRHVTRSIYFNDYLKNTND